MLFLFGGILYLECHRFQTCQISDKDTLSVTQKHIVVNRRCVLQEDQGQHFPQAQAENGDVDPFYNDLAGGFQYIYSNHDM